MGKWGPPWDQTRRPNDLLVEPVTEINTKVGRRPLPRRWQAPPASQKVVTKSASTGPALELRENDTKLKGERYKIVEYQDPRVRKLLNISTSMTPIPKEITVMDSMKSVMVINSSGTHMTRRNGGRCVSLMLQMRRSLTFAASI